MKTVSKIAVQLTVAWLLLQLPFLTAADTKAVPQAPIPSQILEAKKIFIANAGEDEMVELQPRFSGGSDRAYNQFYAAMKSWGRYQIVSAPAEADLLLETEVSVMAVEPSGKSGDSYTPLFRLKIRDPKTNAILWGFNVHAQFGLGQGASDKVFDQAVNRLVADVQALAGRAPVPPDGAATP